MGEGGGGGGGGRGRGARRFGVHFSCMCWYQQPCRRLFVCLHIKRLQNRITHEIRGACRDKIIYVFIASTVEHFYVVGSYISDQFFYIH